MSRLRRLGRRLVRRPGTLASSFALVWWMAAATPTLMPRSGMIQGVICGVSAAVGLGLGMLVAATWRWAAGAAGRALPGWVDRRPGGRFAAVAAAVLVAGAVGAVVWGRSAREALGMDPAEVGTVPSVLVVGVFVFALVVVLSRAVAAPVVVADRALARRWSRSLAHVVVGAATVLIGVVLSRDVVADALLDVANQSFSVSDRSTPEGAVEPTSPLRSGGPGSAVSFDSLGEQGRLFVGTGPTVEDLRSFSDDPGAVVEPVRVYVGLRTAATPEARAALAVAELDRTGAWDRSVLVLTTTTGTGWINPVAADSVEYLHDGDTAIVGTQYSYFPSWISFLVDGDKVAAEASALREAVLARWSALPADARPQLLVYGESLGSQGSEVAVAQPTLSESVAEATLGPDGVLWVGPTFSNPVFDQVVAARRPGAPVWWPEVDGVDVRLAGRPGPAVTPGPSGGVVYLTHPTDPVTWVSPSQFWSRPAWMGDPPPELPGPYVWLPGVTGIQGVFDLMAGFGAPPGYGHNYEPNIVDGWVLVAPPDGWTAADTDRLNARLGVG